MSGRPLAAGPVPAVGADPASRVALREQNVREQFIAVEEVKQLRDAVAACYRKHGVNHYEMCKDEVAAYRARTEKGQFPLWGALRKTPADLGAEE